MLRHIRAASKQELINHQPVVHTWSYMLNGAA
jgi:hypothetical protein